MDYREYIAHRVAVMLRERAVVTVGKGKSGGQMECPTCRTAGEVLVEKRLVVKGKSTTGAVVERCKTCGGRGWIKAR